MTKPATEPIELLRTLGERYRHVEQEHQRQPPRGATRHRIETEASTIHDHFERLLSEWVSDNELRDRWREFLRGRAAAPEGPALPSPPLFKGLTDAGARLEVRPVSDGYDILIDGARIDHNAVPWHLEPDMRGRVQIGERACDEVFDAPEPAVNALAELVAGGASPPWRWARELIEDGLIDTEFSLTPRGERCLARRREAAIPAGDTHRFCVLVADAARARVWVLDGTDGGAGPALVEAAEITNPMLRARDSDVVADSGSGRRGGAKTPIHSPPDHRDHRRRDIERHFAAQVAEEAAAVWRRYPSCDLIVAASPVMLGLLRPAIDRQIRPKDRIDLKELPRDLSKLTGPALHDLLANDNLLPERGRAAPILPAPGLPT